MKAKLLISGLILSSIILTVTSITNSENIDYTKAAEGIDSIQTNNYANTNLAYYYCIPSTVIKNRQRAHPLLVMVPGLSGRGEHFVTVEFKDFAKKEGFVIVAPSFVWDEKNWQSQRSYQYPSVWSGEALIRIINKLKQKYGLSLSKLYLYGFSAGAQFALRFCLWKPELCAACAAYAGGGTIIPDKRNNVKFFISAGKQDTERIQKAETFYNSAKRVGIDVTYKLYEGGHSLPQEQINDSLRFFKEIKDSYY